MCYTDKKQKGVPIMMTKKTSASRRDSFAFTYVRFWAGYLFYTPDRAARM